MSKNNHLSNSNRNIYNSEKSNFGINSVNLSEYES